MSGAMSGTMSGAASEAGDTAPGEAAGAARRAPLPRVGIVGAGAVGCALAWALEAAGIAVVAASSRDRARRDRVAAGLRTGSAMQVLAEPQAVADASELVLLSVSDRAIASACASLRWRPGQRVVHCSGATEVAALEAARQAGVLTGGFHPVQTFTDPSVALRTLPGCAVGIEAADAGLRAELEALAVALGLRAIVLPPGARAAYHASANYVGPFLIALLREASSLWREFGATEAQALSALLPLAHGTLAAAAHAGLPGALAGAVSRGDVDTVARHIAALDAVSTDTGTLYRTLALRTVPLGLERGSLASENADRLRALLAPTRPDAAREATGRSGSARRGRAR